MNRTIPVSKHQALRLQACGWIIILAAIQAGCAAQRTAIDRVDPDFAASSGNKARIEVTRDPGGACSDALVNVLIDNDHAGGVGPGETLQLYLAPGLHIVGVTANANCPADVATRYITVSDLRPVSMKVGFDFFGHIRWAK